MQEYSIYRDNARDEGEKMKVKYKNANLGVRNYKHLSQIKCDIEYLENLVANAAKKYKRDLNLAREMYEVFKMIYDV